MYVSTNARVLCHDKLGFIGMRGVRRDLGRRVNDWVRGPVLIAITHGFSSYVFCIVSGRSFEGLPTLRKHWPPGFMQHNSPAHVEWFVHGVALMVNACAG